jgi:hypothetical protein
MPHVGVVAAVDRCWEAAEKGPRPHLGASVVGKPCDRAMVYGFRHAVRKKTEGRMLRLFNRGHLEEIRICAWLRMVGMEVREFAQRLTYHEATGTYAAMEWPEDDGMFSGELPPGIVDVSEYPEHVACAALAGVELRQWSFSDVGGHHAGSSDGKARIRADCMHSFTGLPAPTLREGYTLSPDEDPMAAYAPGAWFGLEFKTYNAKSFKYLTDADDVRAAKPEHYSQTQEYMHYMGLPCVLYMGVCKDNDRVFEQVVPYDRTAAVMAVEKANRGVAARKLPPRISSSAANQLCKFCDYRGPCHFGEPMPRSCRTCCNSVAVTTKPGAAWACEKWGAEIPKDVQKAGCDAWSAMTD